MPGDSIGEGVYTALWLFFIYGLAGVVVETLYCSLIIYRGDFQSRMGLLYVPINPIYGFGGAVLSLALVGLVANPLLIFLAGLVVCTAFEYLASLVIWRVLGSVSWDYSDRAFNIQGRVSLLSAVQWGLWSLLVLYVLQPIVAGLISAIPRPAGDVALGVLLSLTVASVALTIAAFARTREKISALEDGAPLPDSARSRLVDRLAPDAVVLTTFPRVSLIVRYRELRSEARTG